MPDIDFRKMEKTMSATTTNHKQSKLELIIKEQEHQLDWLQEKISELRGINTRVFGSSDMPHIAGDRAEEKVGLDALGTLDKLAVNQTLFQDLAAELNTHVTRLKDL